MNQEMMLNSRIVRHGPLALAEADAWGISADDFLTFDGRALYNYLVDYQSSAATRGSIPGVFQLQTLFPSFQLCDDEGMTTAALCHEVRTTRLRKGVSKLLVEANSAMDGDPLLLLQELQTKAHSLTALNSGLVGSTFSGSVDRAMARYEKIARGELVHPIQWPWDILNRETGGIEDTGYVIYYGRPKNKKTFIVLNHAMHIFRVQGKHVLFYSKEMPEEQIWWRLMAFLGNIDYGAFNKGELIDADRNHLYMMSEWVKHQAASTLGKQQITCISGRDAPDGADTVAWLTSQVKRIKPDAVFIDGIYLMSSHVKARDAHARIEAVSRAVRQMALYLKIPVIGTIQANRGADKSGLEADVDEMAASDAFGQDATAAVRVAASRFDNTVNLLFPGSREWKLHGIQINAIPCINFSYLKTLDPQQVAQAKLEDKPDDDDQTTGGVRVPPKRGKTKPTQGPLARLEEEAPVPDSQRPPP